MSILQTIIPKSDQLNVEDFIGTAEKTIVVKSVTVDLAKQEQPVELSYEGDAGKPWKPCKSMRRLLVIAWGDDVRRWAGRSILLYADSKVVYAGVPVGGIRVKALSDIAAPLNCVLSVSKGKKVAFTVEPLKVELISPEQAKELEELLDSPERLQEFLTLAKLKSLAELPLAKFERAKTFANSTSTK